MNMIVIEGDNGTGKDTLAQGLEPHGFNIITYHPEACTALGKAREAAKEGTSVASVLAFLRYNMECSRLAGEQDSRFLTNILIRYWPSTLASAYADKGWSIREVDDILDDLLPRVAAPLCVIRLTCDMDERVRRIKERNAPGFDDITIERARKYEFIFSHIMQRAPYDWVTIPTAGASRQEIVKKALATVNGLRREIA